MIHLDTASGMMPLWNVAIPLLAITGILFLVASVVIAVRRHVYQSILMATFAIVIIVAMLVAMPWFDGIKDGNRALFEDSYGIGTRHASIVGKGNRESLDAVIGMAEQGTYRVKADQGRHAGKTLDVIIDKNGGVKVVDHATGRAMTPKTGKGE